MGLLRLQENGETLRKKEKKKKELISVMEIGDWRWMWCQLGTMMTDE